MERRQSLSEGVLSDCKHLVSGDFNRAVVLNLPNAVCDPLIQFLMWCRSPTLQLDLLILHNCRFATVRNHNVKCNGKKMQDHRDVTPKGLRPTG